MQYNKFEKNGNIRNEYSVCAFYKALLQNKTHVVSVFVSERGRIGNRKKEENNEAREIENKDIRRYIITVLHF